MSAAHSEPIAHSVMTKCHRCQSSYDALKAAWCACHRSTRTLRCLSCGSCFCDAPVPYRRTFWAAAPAHLRQNPARFAADKSAFPSATYERAVAPNAPVVVIADDDEAIRSLVACYVQSLGYRIRITGDPVEALGLAQSDDVRVLITDALMPRLDGRELCRLVKRSRIGGPKKVIVMTSLYTARRFRSEAFHLFDVDEYLTKPVDLHHLGQVLAKFAPLPGLNSDECPDPEQAPVSMQG